MFSVITWFTKVMGLAIRRDLHENVATIALGLARTILTIGVTTIATTRPIVATIITLELATTITTLASSLPIHVNLTFDIDTT
jgi:hypothetical protein